MSFGNKRMAFADKWTTKNTHKNNPVSAIRVLR